MMRRTRLYAALAGALALGSVPNLNAQAKPRTNTEQVLGGPRTPAHGYDLVHQRVEVRSFDWDSTSFDGRVTSTLVSRRAGLDSVVLDMGRRLEVRSVTGDAVGFRRAADTIVVALRRPAPIGDTVRFTIAYKGRIQQGRGLYFFKATEQHPAQVYSGGGTDGNPNWIPTYAAPDDKITWEVIATVPRGFDVISNGRLVSDRPVNGGRLHTVHWAQRQPVSTYLLSIVVAPLARVRDRWRDVPLDYYVYHRDSVLARPLFGLTPDVMEVYTRLTGVRYPWPRYAQTTVAEFIGGMENVGATTLVDWLPDRRAYLDRPWFRQVLIPHELAHQWFGNLVTARDWSNYWLHEGIADFMPGQYWGEKQGRHAEDDYYLEKYDDFLRRDSVRRVPLAAYNSNVVYPKGALTLSMLKKHIGPERFWAGINRYLTRHAFGTADSDDLRVAFQEVAGEDLRWFWDQWVYGAGYPELDVSAAYDSSTSTVTLTVNQTQVPNVRYDTTLARYETPAAFRLPVTIRIGTAHGDVVHRADLTRRNDTLRIGGVRSAPTMVVFDDGNATVKRLTFHQPTSWLATQLARDPDLWNRRWVIGELAGRPDDAAAGTALAQAARTADYDRTRAEAAAGLGEFPAAIALPALEAAVRDTSARVREAAVGALGLVGGPRALALASERWSADSSYRVRAVALASMVRLDPAGSRADVETGLRTDSYGDVIRSTAVWLSGGRKP